MSDLHEEHNRQNDVVIAQVAQKLDDFLNRYERDWAHTQNWRVDHDQKLKEYGDILNEIAPNYRRGVFVVSAIVLGSIGVAVKIFWSHVRWG